MKSINYPALSLEEDVILEIQIDRGPSPKTEYGISEEGMSHYKISCSQCSGFFCFTNQLISHVSALTYFNKVQ